MTDENGAQHPTELEQKIIKQVEFYFGDINLSRDKFLQEQTKQDEGWVTLDIMLKFNRLRMLSEDKAVIIAALKSSTSGLMEVSEDGTKIRRSVVKPLPDSTKERNDTIKQRSIYAKGIPIDATLDQVMQFFDKFGPTEHIQMRRDNKKVFKGSCFVIYGSEESAKKFLAEPNLKYGGFETEMVRRLKDDYFKLKNEEKKKKSEDKSKVNEEKKQKKEEEEKEKVREAMVCGALLDVESVPTTTKRDDLKTFFLQFGKVEWVDLESEATQGRIRYNEVDGAKKALEKATEAGGGKVVMNDVELKCRVLDGEEELDHWVGVTKARNDKKHSFKNPSKGGHKGGHKGGYKRKSEDDGSSRGKRSRVDERGDASNKCQSSPNNSLSKRPKMAVDSGSDGGGTSD